MFKLDVDTINGNALDVYIWQLRHLTCIFVFLFGHTIVFLTLRSSIPPTTPPISSRTLIYVCLFSGLECLFYILCE